MHTTHSTTKISQTRSYTLKLDGMLDEEFVSSFCPAHSVISHQEDGTTLLVTNTDQSGVIGLIRALHNLGFILLSLQG
jgi:hypothetical protein